jgi:hypothetical protein
VVGEGDGIGGGGLLELPDGGNEDIGAFDDGSAAVGGVRETDSREDRASACFFEETGSHAA